MPLKCLLELPRTTDLDPAVLRPVPTHRDLRTITGQKRGALGNDWSIIRSLPFPDLAAYRKMPECPLSRSTFLHVKVDPARQADPDQQTRQNLH
jgi:hypothetical protein